MQFFAGALKFNIEGEVDFENGVSPRANFDSLMWAFVTVFQVLLGDDWNSVMYNCIRCTGWAASLYFIVLILFGNVIMLNLFLAILIGKFEEQSILLKEQQFINETIKLSKIYDLNAMMANGNHSFCFNLYIDNFNENKNDQSNTPRGQLKNT